MDFLHQFTLPCVLWFFSFIKPSLGHLPLARTFFFALLQGIFIYPVKRENFPFTVQYNDTNIRSKSLWLSHFCFLLVHFFGLRNLYRACMLNLGYHWTGYLFYHLKKSSRHKVRTWHFTQAYRLPPIESHYPPPPIRRDRESDLLCRFQVDGRISTTLSSLIACQTSFGH